MDEHELVVAVLAASKPNLIRQPPVDRRLAFPLQLVVVQVGEIEDLVPAIRDVLEPRRKDWANRVRHVMLPFRMPGNSRILGEGLSPHRHRGSPRPPRRSRGRTASARNHRLTRSEASGIEAVKACIRSAPSVRISITSIRVDFETSGSIVALITSTPRRRDDVSLIPATMTGTRHSIVTTPGSGAGPRPREACP